MKAALYTLGCKVNQYESQIMEQELISAGFEIVPTAAKADVYIINSCTVTSESDRKTRQAARKLKRQNPGALIVLTGCMPQAAGNKSEDFGFADIVAGTRERGGIAKVIKNAIDSGGKLNCVCGFETGEHFEKMSASGFEGHTRAFVKIEDGCSRYCSYCIIPYARGPVRSKSIQDLTEELKTLAGNGYREAVLVGINLSAYGSDFGTGLADAIEAAADIPGIERVRLGSLEPGIITEDFVQKAAGCKKLCPHFHLSLQSGCAETLKRMNRHYTPEGFENAVRLLREALPGCAVTTDVIVGFPGETEAEFEESVGFVKKIGFAKAHIFAYSRREGTKAAVMPGQVTKPEKERRSGLMSEACRPAREEFLIRHVGGVYSVLLESFGGSGSCEGYTPDYAPVRVDSAENLRGTISNILVTSADGEMCYGKAMNHR